MKIGILCHSSLGGSTKIAVELARQLVVRKHSVELFSRSNPLGVPIWPDGISINTLYASSDKPLTSLYINWPEKEINAFVTQIVNRVRAVHLDVLHYHYALPFAFVVAKVREILKSETPFLVGTFHGTDVVGYKPEADAMQHFLKSIQKTNILTSVSNNHANLAQQTFQLTQTPLTIPNFITNRSVSFTVDSSSLPSTKKERPLRIIHVSNFRPVKQTRQLAQIFIKLSKLISAELWLVGDGPDFLSVKEDLTQAGLQAKTRFFGIQDNVFSILHQCDVLLVTSKYESFCLAALEAMSVGLPVVAPEVGGLPELVEDQFSGFLVQPNNKEIYCKALIELYKNPHKLQQMKKRAILRAQEFSAAKSVDAYEQIYNSR